MRSMRSATPRRLCRCMLLVAVVLASCTSGPAQPEPAGSPRIVTPAGSSSPTSPLSPSPSQSQVAPAVPKPSIVWKPIPFSEERKRQMAAYSVRHYSLDTNELIHPQVVVEHFTATDTFQVAWNTFASNAPDLGELPGTCAHFVIDADGTIYQLVPLGLMCRHASGMNWTALGIEMVANSDREVLDNPRQLDAALALTLWLMDRFEIELRNVIGHNENLTSPLRIENVASFRCQTHGDWTHADMEVFRSRLAKLADRYGVPLGPPAKRVQRGC